VENHEPRDERYAVRHEVGDVYEEHPHRMRETHPQGLLVRELRRQRQHDRGADGDGAERQGLADQVRPALPLPRPAAQDVADRRASEPCRDRRFARGRARGSEQERQRDLAHREGDDRHGHEPAEPFAQRRPEPAPHGRDKPGRNECHGSPSCSEDRRVIQTGIQYGNRTRLEVGDLRIEAGPRWRGRRRRAADAGHRGRAPPPSGASRASIGAA
jgi:hypothetical protein